MKKTSTFILSLGLIAAFTACSDKNENPTGSWTSAAPTTVTINDVPATTATKTISFDFVAPADKASAGTFSYTAEYDVKATAEQPAYKATATIKGTWTPKDREDDEYLLSFDKNSLNVSGVDAPGLGAVTDEFTSTLTKFVKIEDVKVSKDGAHMSFETDHPDTDYHFVKK